MANKLYIVFLLIFGLTTASCETTKQSTLITNADQLNAHVGKRVMLYGKPIGSKANHALLTTFGRIALDKAWPLQVYDPSRVEMENILISALLDKEKEAVFEQPEMPIQTTSTQGERLPEQFVLRSVEIIEAPAIKVP